MIRTADQIGLLSRLAATPRPQQALVFADSNGETKWLQLRAKRAKLNRQIAALERAVDGTESKAPPGTFARLAGFESKRTTSSSWSIGPGGSKTARPRWKGLQEAITVWPKARVCATWPGRWAAVHRDGQIYSFQNSHNR